MKRDINFLNEIDILLKKAQVDEFLDESDEPKYKSEKRYDIYMELLSGELMSLDHSRDPDEVIIMARRLTEEVGLESDIRRYVVIESSHEKNDPDITIDDVVAFITEEGLDLVVSEDFFYGFKTKPVSIGDMIPGDKPDAFDEYVDKFPPDELGDSKEIPIGRMIEDFSEDFTEEEMKSFRSHELMARSSALIGELTSFAQRLDDSGKTTQADFVDQAIKKLALFGKNEKDDVDAPQIKRNPAETIKPSGYHELRGNVAIYKSPIPGGRTQLIAFWPDADGSYPTMAQTPEGPKYTYLSGSASQKSVRDVNVPPAGFEDVAYFVGPNSQTNFSYDPETYTDEAGVVWTHKGSPSFNQNLDKWESSQGKVLQVPRGQKPTSVFKQPESKRPDVTPAPLPEKPQAESETKKPGYWDLIKALGPQ